MIRRRTAIFAAVLFTLALCAQAFGQEWQNSDFGKRIDATIPSPDGNLTAHPVPFKLDGRSIVDTDIVSGEWAFYDSTDTLLDWELESYAEAAGTCTGIIHIAVAQYAAPAGEQNHVYFYYNKISGSTPANTPTDVWDANYVGVWHLNETGTGSAGDYLDATSNDNDSVSTANQPTATSAGKIDGAESFDGSEYVTVDTLGIINASHPWTLEAWIKTDTVSAGERMVLWNGRSSFSYPQIGLIINNTSGNIRTVVGKYFAGSVLLDTASDVLDATNWFHIVGTYDGSSSTDGMAIYVNGAVEGTTPTSGGSIAGMGAHDSWNIGSNNAAGSYFDGKIDEARVSAAVRTADWIKQTFTVTDTGLSYAAIESASAFVPFLRPALSGGLL